MWIVFDYDIFFKLVGWFDMNLFLFLDNFTKKYF